MTRSSIGQLALLKIQMFCKWIKSFSWIKSLSLWEQKCRMFHKHHIMTYLIVQFKNKFLFSSVQMHITKSTKPASTAYNLHYQPMCFVNTSYRVIQITCNLSWTTIDSRVNQKMFVSNYLTIRPVVSIMNIFEVCYMPSMSIQRKSATHWLPYFLRY